MRFTGDEPPSKRVRGATLSREPPKLCPWCWTLMRATKARASVAVVGKMPSIPRAAAIG